MPHPHTHGNTPWKHSVVILRANTFPWLQSLGYIIIYCTLNISSVVIKDTVANQPINQGCLSAE